MWMKLCLRALFSDSGSPGYHFLALPLDRVSCRLLSQWSPRLPHACHPQLLCFLFNKALLLTAEPRSQGPPGWNCPSPTDWSLLSTVFMSAGWGMRPRDTTAVIWAANALAYSHPTPSSSSRENIQGLNKNQSTVNQSVCLCWNLNGK